MRRGQASDGPTLERILSGVTLITHLPGAWSGGEVLPTLSHTSEHTNTDGPQDLAKRPSTWEQAINQGRTINSTSREC